MKKENKEKMIKGFKTVVCDIGVINISTCIAFSAFTGFNLNSIKAATRIRKVPHYNMSVDENIVKLEKTSNYTGLNLIGTYNSYIGEEHANTEGLELSRIYTSNEKIENDVLEKYAIADPDVEKINKLYTGFEDFDCYTYAVYTKR